MANPLVLLKEAILTKKYDLFVSQFQMIMNPAILNALDPHDGNTLLHNACYLGETRIVSFMILHGCIDPNIRNRQQDTPLMVACMMRQAEVARILLNHSGVDHNARDVHGNCALMYSCFLGDLKTVKILLASNRIFDTGGHRVVGSDVIFSAKDRDVIHYVTKYRADPDMTRTIIQRDLKSDQQYLLEDHSVFTDDEHMNKKRRV